MSTLSNTIPAQYFASRRASGHFSMRGRDYQVELKLPSLSDSSKSIWADWGPMCTCKLTTGQAVELTYREQGSAKSATYVVTPPTVGLNSPSRAEERRIHPFYVELVDAARGVKLEVYLDHEGLTTRIDVSALHACIDFPALVFCESEQTAMAS